MSTTWTRRITITYHEVKRSETSETTTTAILVEGPPLLYEFRKGDGLGKDIEVERIKDLLVPKGQEVVLKEFIQPFHELQLLVFTTICDHGD